VATRSFDLIETMAAAIGAECLTYERVVRASVVVHKPNAASRLAIDGVAAAVTLPED
jgi:dihydroneopterin aldolase